MKLNFNSINSAYWTLSTQQLIHSTPSRYNFSLSTDRLKPLEVTGITVVKLEIEVEIELENVLDRNGLSRKELKLKWKLKLKSKITAN